MKKNALLALADGSLFWGESIGASGATVGEVVFNTALTGYQEILTDPSYCQQLIALTYPHIGNTGMNAQDEEDERIHASGLIVRDCPRTHANWRSSESLPAYLKRRHILGIAGIDTRKLTRHLRERGAQHGCIMADDSQAIDSAVAIAKARDYAGLAGLDLAQVVSTSQSYPWTQGVWDLSLNDFNQPQSSRYHVVAYDFGVKRNILRMLVQRGCKVTVVPAKTPASDVLALQPDGVFLSNGPGDPEPCDYAIAAIRIFLDQKIPLFGICLGHQLLGLAAGAKTIKMKCGHHGGNHPVHDLNRNRVMISSQNHGFALDEQSLPSTVRAYAHSLFDGSLQGIEFTDRPAFGFQGHPEASPGPHDVEPFFDRFIQLMQVAH